MRYALPGSALLHVGLLGMFLIGFSAGEIDDAPAPAPVSVSIVALSTVASNSTEVIESDATVTTVSSGSEVETIEPLTAEPLDPVETAIEPLTPETVEETVSVAQEAVEPEAVAEDTLEPVEPVEPVEAPPLEELTAMSADAIESALAPVMPIEIASIEPISEEDFKVAPVPQTLSFERPSAPTSRPQAQQPRKEQQLKHTPPSQAGNGGQNQSDSVAAAGAPAMASGQGNGGQAEVARYPSIVVGELRRALRRTGASRGELIVRFTVNANGSLAGASVARSSGNAAVDAAGIATVERAAPFPPIPPAAGRNSWTFDVPLAFGG